MKISVIIACLDESRYIKNTIQHLLSLQGNFEIIVVDGGSSDNTLSIVAEFNGLRIISSEKGRSIQMNTGAKEAKAEIFLFLHADTFLPENAFELISRCLEEEEVVAGSFYLRFDDDCRLMNFYSRLSKINHPFFTYGDHGIFIRKSVFQEIGGYKEIPFMEDVEIHKRIRREGRFKKLNAPVLTSARRFRKTGVFKQFTLDLYLVLLYKLGVSPVRLKKFYKDHE